ncbi:MAG TPA: hypothetical protein VG408_10070 [Actinomycetota bacterium]|nr:hypothetical protein [Actinomycetota bacterium]
MRRVSAFEHATVCAVIGAALLAAPSHATVPGEIEAKTYLIEEADRAKFGIKEIRWVPASGSAPAHAYILGCHACGPASYTPAGELSDPGSLPSIPTSYTLRVPENYSSKLVANVPPGVSTQTFLRPRHLHLLSDGFAVAVMNHPMPGFPGFPYERFIAPPHSAADYGHGYAATGHLLRDLLTELYAAPAHAYALGNSRGVLAGVGLLAARADRPFDGYVMVSGGNGALSELAVFMRSYLSDRKVPLTGLPAPGTDLPPEEIEPALAHSIGTADPEYRAMVLSGQASALEYDVTTRPKSVQRAWNHLDYGAEIAVPVILVHGLRDTTVWPSETLQHAQRIIDAGRQDLLRLYLIKEMGHNPPNPPNPTDELYANSVRILDAWVTTGAEPGPIDAGALGSHPSCDARGYEADPIACFADVFGTGF